MVTGVYIVLDYIFLRKEVEKMAGVEGEDSVVEEVVVVVENNTCHHHHNNKETSDQTSSPKGKLYCNVFLYTLIYTLSTY